MSRSQTLRAARRAARELEPGKRKPPYHVGFRWDYENARRAGRTQPDLIEVLDAGDPRHRNAAQHQPRNRAWKRAAGVRGGNQATARKSSRRRPVVRCVERLAFETTGEVVRCSLAQHGGEHHLGRIYRTMDHETGAKAWKHFTWWHDAKAGLQMRTMQTQSGDLAESEAAAA